MRARREEIFLRQASFCDGRSPLYAALCRRLAGDGRVDRIAPDLRWYLPLRLLGGLHYLVLAGRAALDDVDGALDEHGDFLARHAAEQQVQTNEVQRAWALLPAFLSLHDGRPFDLLELGPSAGLNLLWDRYAYRYRTGSWGVSALTLSGDDRIPPPAELLQREVRVVRRRGIDLSPVDVTTGHGARVLESFVWADQTERLERLRRAIAILRAEPPELIRGDYADGLARLLADRVPGSHLVVFQTASTMYLTAEQLGRVGEALREAARHEPLSYLGTANGAADSGYSLEVERRPAGSNERLAVFDFHGEWLEWSG